MKSQLKSLFGPEKKIAKTRNLLKESRFEEAVSLAKELIETWPERHEGWRLLIEGTAKGSRPVEEGLSYFFFADLRDQLEGSAAPKQAYHIITSILKVSRNVEILERSKFPSAIPSDELKGNDRGHYFLNIVTAGLKDTKSVIADGECRQIGLELAKHIDKTTCKDIGPWSELFKAALERTNAIEQIPGFGVRNATSGLLILRYFLSADNVKDQKLYGKLTRDILSILAYKVNSDADLSGLATKSTAILKSGYFPYVIDIKFKALSALVSPLQMQYISSVEAQFEQIQIQQKAEEKAKQEADKQRALEIKQAAEELERQRREEEEALAEERRLNAERERSKAKKLAAEAAARRALAAEEAEKSKLDANKLFRQAEYSAALRLYLEKFADNVTDKRIFDQIVKCHLAIDPKTAALNIEKSLGPLIAKHKHNSLQLFYLANAIAGAKKQGRIFRSPERLQAEDFISSGLRANSNQFPLWQEKFLLDVSRCNFKGAAKTLREISGVFPDSPDVLVLKSVLARVQGQLDEAVKFGLEAKAHPRMKNASGILKYIDALSARGQVAAAEHEIAEGLVLAPRNGELIKNRLEALINLGALHAASDFAKSKKLPFATIPSEFAESVCFKSKTRLIHLVEKTANPLKSKYSISDETSPADLKKLISDSKFEFFIFSRNRLSRSQQAGLCAELRSAVGVTFFATPDVLKIESHPGVFSASAVLIRREDVLDCLNAERSQSVIKALSKAATRLSAQYVPCVDGSKFVPLGLRENRRLAKKIMVDTALRNAIDLKANSLVEAKLKWIESKSIDGQFSKMGAGSLILNVKDWNPDVDISRFSDSIIFCASDMTDSDLRKISETPELKSAWSLQFANATSVVTTQKSVALWLEDTFRIAVPVHKSLSDGLERALSFNTCKFVVNVGAGIGNILQATPLIRWLSKRLDQPIDVCIHSSVGISHELFGESEFINLAYHSTDIFGGRHYDKAFCASTFGADAKGVLANQIFNQRKVYDFYGQTQFVSEAKYHFFGIWNLEGEKEDLRHISVNPFIRNYAEPPQDMGGCKEIPSAKIGLAGGKRGVLWGKRQWSQFDQLARILLDQGAELHSFGGPEEDIPGCIDHTHSKLRDSIEKIRQMDVFVCSDGGAFHMADALKVPTVCVFGPTSAVKNGPMSRATSVIRTERACSPCQFRPEFVTCETALCMRDVTTDMVKDEIVGKLKHDYGWCGHPYSKAIEMEFDRQHVLVRTAYSDVFFNESFSLYKYFNPSWDYVFNSVVREHRMERAEDIVKWAIQHEGQMTDDIRYARARAAYIGRKFKLCISYAENDYDKVARPWLLKNFLFRSLLSEQDYTKIIELWTAWRGTECESIAEDENAWVETATCALRAMAMQGTHHSELIKLRRRLKLVIDGSSNQYRDPQAYINQLDDSYYRRPDKQFTTLPSRKVTFAVIDDWNNPPACLKKYHKDVGVYALYENEVGRIDLPDVDYILKLAPVDKPLSDDTENDDVTVLPNFQPHFIYNFRLTDLSGREWDVWGKENAGKAENPNTVEGLIASHAVDVSERQAERIMVVAHHHLEKYNPRGGERSTAAIVDRLKAQGYEVITVVDHKKTKEYGLDQASDLTDYILFGPFAFKSGLSGAMASWRPDMVLTYGGVALRAAPVCVAHDIPFIFFPRDWGEVCPRPHLNLVNRQAILNPQNEYKFTYDEAAKVVTNANYVGEVIQNIYGSDSINSYVPVKPPLSSASIRPLSERTEILLINARKFLGGQLVRQLATLRPELKFRVIGGDNLPFPDNVIVEPFFNGRDYTDMYKNAALFLFPLGEDDPCGTGRVVFEALMSQTPVLSLDRGGMKEVLPQDWLLQKNTPQAWAVAIDKMMAQSFDEESLENLVAVFDYRKQLDIIDDAVREVLQSAE